MAINGKLPALTSTLPCAVDTMGGDLGLSVQVEGAVSAFKEFGAKSILVGPKEELSQKLDSLGAKNHPISIHHAPDVITMEDSPVRAVRRKPEASLCVAFGLLRDGLASSVLSSGNSGAMMAAGRLICGLLPGIERPAIATLIPTAGGGNPNVVLDSGANVDCHAQNLVQFAVMGSIYYASLFGDSRPRVGILSNGTEPSKGNDITRGAALFLSQMESINYVGYVEGRDIAQNIADIVVCDGFIGNVVLKTMEGMVKLIGQELKNESRKGLLEKLGLALSKPALRRIFVERFDHSAQGGAPLLGLNKLALVLHGSSDSRSVKNALHIAENFAKNRMTEKIAAALTNLDDSMTEFAGDFVPGMFSGKINNDKNHSGARVTADQNVVEDEKGQE
jgi:glycerol-3-phosphate acyltransferase PlsX